ncbi:MAG: iron-siderophore ABC transporter substrate-binding protein [Brevibacterium aurantiacum]|nr:iron-siderophore ABC transporter substrate-binding protein [Brevibacterium sp.]MDN5607005.1 iron-siderophore ABC transporter substrate-binding protein [Brevibacterium sp.]MDN6378956.1 iron-siderophore ABC transporter substrate-binding protein [Brevibacterium aurantiacum]
MSLSTLPRTRPRKPLLVLASVSAVCALALSACGTTSTDASAKEDTSTSTSGDCAEDSSTTSADPVSVKDDTGHSIQLDSPADTVVSLEWQYTEDLLSLCVDPAAVADAQGFTTWDTAEKLPEDTTDVGTRQEPNVESILSANPDLVIIETTSRDDKIVGQLEDQGIPVMAMTGADGKDPIGYMKATFSTLAEVTGRGERADSVLDDFDAKVEESKKAIESADLETEEFVYFDGWVNGSNVALRPFGQGSLFGELGEELGLKNVWTGEVDPAYGLGQTDIEGISKVGDANFFYTGTDDPDSEDFVDLLKKNDIWSNIPAVKDERTYAFPSGIWTFGGPKSSEQALDAYVDALTK